MMTSGKRTRGLVCEDDDIAASDTKNGTFLLIKVITDRPIKANAFIDAMASAWRLVKIWR